MSFRSFQPAKITAAAAAGALKIIDNEHQSSCVRTGCRRIFTSFDEIVDHCCYAWNTLIDQPWKIMSVARRDWAVAGHSL